MHNAQPSGPEYFVEEHGFDNGSQLQVIKMLNVLNTASNPTAIGSAVVNVPSYGAPPSAVQPGGRGVNTGDTRILNVAESGGRLIATQNVGNGSVANARVYDMGVSSTGFTVGLNQTLQINPGGGTSTYYPAADIDPSGDLGITYMESSRKEDMSMYVTGQTTAMPSGYVLQPVQVKAGQGTYLGSRAGDYSGIGFDPSTGEFWAGSEYAQTSSNYWGTWIAGFGVAYASGDSLLNATPGSSGSSGGGGGHHNHTGQPIPNLDDPLIFLLAAAESSKKKS